MKKLFFAAVAFALSMPLMAQTPITIPEVAQWTAADGNVTFSGRIVVKNSSLADIAQMLCDDLSAITTNKFQIVSGSAKPGDIVLTIKTDKKANAESYTITTDQTIKITAPTATGVLWGTQTLLQMSKNGTVAKGTIKDAPQYKLRGFMLDCGRKFFPLSYIRQLARTMAYYKMNTLHLHLNDNGFKRYHGESWDKTQAAFRLESDVFPGLTAKDGSYSKAEFRQLIKDCAKMGVEIIPEIDVPAHSLAFTKYRPELGSKEFGMDHFDLGNPGVIPFLDSLFTEYIAGPNPVFCCPKVHIGTDEYNNSKEETREQFRYLTDHLIRLVEKHGKQAICWGALSHAYGSTPVKHENVIMDIWYNGFADPTEMKKQGYELVSIPDGYVYIVPAAGYYYDYLNNHWLYDSWTPAQIGGTKFENNDPVIRGGMFAVWNDHPGNGITVQDVHDRVFPAMQTIATKTWNAHTVKAPWNEFEANMKQIGEAPRVNTLGRTSDLTLMNVISEQPLALGSYNGTEIIEAGYPYEISFTVDCAKENRGTILTSSPNAIFYLNDPQTGNVGFEREGYLHNFNYRLPESGKVTLTIKADNKSTTLFVDGKEKSKLDVQTLYVLNQNPRNVVRTTNATAIVADATTEACKMYYQRTLYFPLQKAGKFNSKVSNLTIK